MTIIIGHTHYLTLNLKEYSSLINTKLLLSIISEYYTGRQLGHK